MTLNLFVCFKIRSSFYATRNVFDNRVLDRSSMLQCRSPVAVFLMEAGPLVTNANSIRACFDDPFGKISITMCCQPLPEGLKCEAFAGGAEHLELGSKTDFADMSILTGGCISALH